MFRDQQKELDRLEKALLEQEDTQPPAAEAFSTPTEENIPPAQEPVVYNNDMADVDIEEFGEDVYNPPKKRSLLPLAVAFAFLTVGFCLLIWFMLKKGGFLG